MPRHSNEYAVNELLRTSELNKKRPLFMAGKELEAHRGSGRLGQVLLDKGGEVILRHVDDKTTAVYLHSEVSREVEAYWVVEYNDAGERYYTEFSSEGSTDTLVRELTSAGTYHKVKGPYPQNGKTAFRTHVKIPPKTMYAWIRGDDNE